MNRPMKYDGLCFNTELMWNTHKRVLISAIEFLSALQNIILV